MISSLCGSCPSKWCQSWEKSSQLGTLWLRVGARIPKLHLWLRASGQSVGPDLKRPMAAVQHPLVPPFYWISFQQLMLSLRLPLPSGSKTKVAQPPLRSGCVRAGKRSAEEAGSDPDSLRWPAITLHTGWAALAMCFNLWASVSLSRTENEIPQLQVCWGSWRTCMGSTQQYTWHISVLNTCYLCQQGLLICLVMRPPIRLPQHCTTWYIFISWSLKHTCTHCSFLPPT